MCAEHKEPRVGFPQSFKKQQDKEVFKGAGLGMKTELGDLRSGTSEKMDPTSWLETHGLLKEAKS